MNSKTVTGVYTLLWFCVALIISEVLCARSEDSCISKNAWGDFFSHMHYTHSYRTLGSTGLTSQALVHQRKDLHESDGNTDSFSFSTGLRSSVSLDYFTRQQ